MAGARDARQEAVRVAVNPAMPTGVERASFGIGDARIHRQPRRFAAASDLDRLFRCERPRMIQIEVRDLTREELRLDQTRVGIFRRIARDRTGLLDRLPDRLPAQIRRTGRALSFPEINRDPETPIALVLDGLHLAQPHGHPEPLAHVSVGFALRGTLTLGFLEHEADNFLELRYSLGIGRLLHHIRLGSLGVGQNCTSRRHSSPPPTGPFSETPVTSEPPRRRQDPAYDFDEPSKSSRKRAAHAAQDLGQELISLRDSELESLDLPERLLDAIREARRITSRGGAARQRQYIGKLMRDVDVEPIRAFLASRNQIDARETERFKRVEAWRERLITEGAAALEELERWRPGIDRDEWSRRLSAAQEERTRTGATGTAGRELFRALRALFDADSPSGTMAR